MHYFLGSVVTSNPKYQVTVQGFDGREKQVFAVSGCTQADFGVSGGNNYDGQGAMLESAMNAGINLLPGFVGKLAAGAKEAYDKGQMVRTATTGADRSSTFIGSQQVWTGSKVPSFSIDLTFVCLDAGDPREDVVTKVNTLMKAVYPEKNGLFIAPPMGYRTNVKGGLTMAGKATLTIGNWFHARYLIIEDVQFSFSKEMNKNGKPIYATGNVILRPYRQITYAEYKGYFK
jgi:hypothetical protein